MNTTSQKGLKLSFFVLSLFLLLFSVTFISVVFFSHPLSRWILLFYNSQTRTYQREVRYLVKFPNQEQALTTLVKEILLGSFNPLYPPVWSRSTPLLCLFLEGTHLYVNVGGVFLWSGEEGLKQLEELIAVNVKENFSFTVKDITLAIEGEVWSPSKGGD